jgi:hypothetical protein
MADYNVYLLDKGDRIYAVRHIDAESDAEALEAARGSATTVDVEVWQLGRFVGRVKKGGVLTAPA